MRVAVLLVALILGLTACAMAVAAASRRAPDPVSAGPPLPSPPADPAEPAPTATAPAPEAVPPPAAAAPVPGPSRAVGRPTAGTLVRGVQLPAEGPDHYTWDPILERFPSRGWRRWGTDRLVETVQQVLARVRAEHPRLPRLAVGDLSRPRGGSFGEEPGFLGHASHQNGLDVDIYYPRDDRRRGKPSTVDGVDRRGAQALVDGFVDAGAQFVFVGLRVRLDGPRDVVQAIAHHDDHLHVRLPSTRRAQLQAAQPTRAQP